jgi:ADP-ribose pyrophosphatase YjhB (NUDIX family)
MKIKYCVECAQPLVKETITKYTCPNGHIFWNNPKGATSLILLKDGQVYFVKRALEPQQGKYDLPGGFLEYGENAFDAARRELLEETGLTVDKMDLIYTTTQHYIENVTVCDYIFVTTEWKGTPKPADDVASIELKPIDFFDSEEFAWDYTGVSDTLKKYIHDRSTKN